MKKENVSFVSHSKNLLIMDLNAAKTLATTDRNSLRMGHVATAHYTQVPLNPVKNASILNVMATTRCFNKVHANDVHHI
jgi:hypothetical protein